MRRCAVVLFSTLLATKRASPTHDRLSECDVAKKPTEARDGFVNCTSRQVLVIPTSLHTFVRLYSLSVLQFHLLLSSHAEASLSCPSFGLLQRTQQAIPNPIFSLSAFLIFFIVPIPNLAVSPFLSCLLALSLPTASRQSVLLSYCAFWCAALARKLLCRSRLDMQYTPL